MKSEKGTFTIEASIVLVVFLFFFMFFLTFANYTAVQNKVKHSLNQTAISMSARNNQLVKMSKVLKKAVGLGTDDIASIVRGFLNAFGLENSDSFTVKLTAYTATYEDFLKDKELFWGDEEMKLEIIRFFAYYYMDLSFNESKNMTYDQIKDMLAGKGLVDVEIKGGNTELQTIKNGHTTLNNSFVNGNELTVNITYKIKTGMFFGSVFGIDDNMIFSDSVTAVLMK